MFDTEAFYQELIAEHGDENAEFIMDSISGVVMDMIEFMAGKADVSFDVMCQSLAATYHQIHEGNAEESA